MEVGRRHHLGLDLLRSRAQSDYYGTGNPGVWNPDMRAGDNKWSITIWARNPETGMAKWAYQIETRSISPASNALRKSVMEEMFSFL
jgi:hypothetical protein